MPYLIIAIFLLLSPILVPVFVILALFVYVSRPAKYQYHHSICREDGD